MSREITLLSPVDLAYRSIKSKSLKVAGRSGLSKPILVRKKVVCFEEGKQLFGANGLHIFRDERSEYNRTII